MGMHVCRTNVSRAMSLRNFCSRDPAHTAPSMSAACPVLRLSSEPAAGGPAELVAMLRGMIQDHQERHERQMQQLTSWRMALDDRQRLLDEREEKLKQREEALLKPQARERKMRILHGWNARVPCDYCGVFYCTRGEMCVGEDGTPLHRHHNCANCHNAWKKGEGKGRRVPGA